VGESDLTLRNELLRFRNVSEDVLASGKPPVPRSRGSTSLPSLKSMHWLSPGSAPGKQTSSVPDLLFPLHGTSPGAPSIPPTLFFACPSCHVRSVPVSAHESCAACAPAGARGCCLLLQDLCKSGCARGGSPGPGPQSGVVRPTGLDRPGRPRINRDYARRGWAAKKFGAPGPESSE